MSTSRFASALVPQTAAGDRLRLLDDLEVSRARLTAEDELTIRSLLRHPSRQSRRRQFFDAVDNLELETHQGPSSADADRYGLLARAPGRGVVAFALYVRMLRRSRAEVAVEVEIADDLQDLGLATQLIIGLAERAEARGITQFVAEVLPENWDMLAVFADAFDTSRVTGHSTVEITFATSGWRTAAAHLTSARSR